jgi:hypothetical protein
VAVAETRSVGWLAVEVVSVKGPEFVSLEQGDGDCQQEQDDQDAELIATADEQGGADAVGVETAVKTLCSSANANTLSPAPRMIRPAIGRTNTPSPI